MLPSNLTYLDAVLRAYDLCGRNRTRSTAPAALLKDPYLPALCSEGFTGPLCGVCATGYGRRRLLECTKCYRRSANTGLYALIVLVNLLSLALTIRATIVRFSAGARSAPPVYSQAREEADRSPTISAPLHAFCVSATTVRVPGLLRTDLLCAFMFHRSSRHGRDMKRQHRAAE